MSITYDTVGNPLNYYNGYSFTWENGRRLSTMAVGMSTWTMGYDNSGMRIRRTDGTTDYRYAYNGGSLTQMTVGNVTLDFAYDASGAPMTVTYDGLVYYYVTNLQGDVTAILNYFGVPVVEYTYDAWGNILSTTGSMANTLGQLNPLRYRGYVYDGETGLYYLQSRYYDPNIGRFLNADKYISTGRGLLGYNMFAYCLNNPVNMIDLFGTMPKFLPENLKEVAQWVDTTIGVLLYVTEVNSKGYLYEYWVENNGKVRWSRHHTNHGNAKKHPLVPHDHEWYDDDDGNNTEDPKWQPTNPGFKAPDSNKNDSAKKAIGAVGGVVLGYVVYVGVKWVVATLAAPTTFGGSLIIAGVTP